MHIMFERKKSEISLEILEQMNTDYYKVMDYYKQQQWNTQVVVKYFNIFLEGRTFYDYYNRCITLKNISRGRTLEKDILFWGEDQGTKRWNEYRERQAYTNSKEYKGMTDDEFKKYNQTRASTIHNFKLRHGDERGDEKWREYCERQAYTNTLEYFIEKYGIDGPERWLKVNKHKSHSYESYIEKHGTQLGEKKYVNYCENSRTIPFSKMSQELFNNICKEIEFDGSIYYATKNKEYGIYNNTLKQYTYFDFVIPELKLCIEFNGNVFHANPKMFTESDTPNPYAKDLTAKQIWEFDNNKNNAIINKGFDIIVVWELEYLQQKSIITQECVKIIKARIDEYRKNK